MELGFANQLRYADEISSFRGALVEHIGRENDAFHNHDNSDSNSGFLYRYPLIQYVPIRRRKAWYPVVRCAGTAATEFHKLFGATDWTIRLNDRREALQLESVQPHEHRLSYLRKPKVYQLQDYIALNQTNFKKFQQCTGLVQQIQFLERMISGHVLALASGMEWSIPERFNTTILSCDSPTPINYKRRNLLSFNLRFQTEIDLPVGLGLGKGASLGYGRIHHPGSHN